MKFLFRIIEISDIIGIKKLRLRKCFGRLQMKISELRELLKDKHVIEEINKHLWIESQKSGYSIGIERATDEWLRLYADGWVKYNSPKKYSKGKGSKRKKSSENS